MNTFEYLYRKQTIRVCIKTKTRRVFEDEKSFQRPTRTLDDTSKNFGRKQ